METKEIKTLEVALQKIEELEKELKKEKESSSYNLTERFKAEAKFKALKDMIKSIVIVID